MVTDQIFTKSKTEPSNVVISCTDGTVSSWKKEEETMWNLYFQKHSKWTCAIS